MAEDFYLPPVLYYKNACLWSYSSNNEQKTVSLTIEDANKIFEGNIRNYAKSAANLQELLQKLRWSGDVSEEYTVYQQYDKSYNSRKTSFKVYDKYYSLNLNTRQSTFRFEILEEGKLGCQRRNIFDRIAG